MSEYKGRDIEALDDEGDYYSKHVYALTEEGLNSKREIAAELAYRDSVIDKTNATLSEAMEVLSRIDHGIDDWNFPIMSGEEVKKLLDDYYGEGVRPDG